MPITTETVKIGTRVTFGAGVVRITRIDRDENGIDVRLYGKNNYGYPVGPLWYEAGDQVGY